MNIRLRLKRSPDGKCQVCWYLAEKNGRVPVGAIECLSQGISKAIQLAQDAGASGGFSRGVFGGGVKAEFDGIEKDDFGVFLLVPVLSVSEENILMVSVIDEIKNKALYITEELSALTTGALGDMIAARYLPYLAQRRNSPVWNPLLK